MLRRKEIWGITKCLEDVAMRRVVFVTCLMLLVLSSLPVYGGVIIQEDDPELKEIYLPDEGTYAQTTPYGMIIEVRWDGATGDMGGYINTQNIAGMYVRWEYDAPAAGEYELQCRFALGSTSGNRDGQININGVDAGTLLMPYSGGWDVWDISNSITISLNEGINEIVMNGVSASGLANVDYIEIIPEPATLALMGLGGLLLRKRK